MWSGTRKKLRQFPVSPLLSVGLSVSCPSVVFYLEPAIQLATPQIQLLCLFPVDPAAANRVAASLPTQVTKRKTVTGPIHLFITMPGSLSVSGPAASYSDRSGEQKGRKLRSRQYGFSQRRVLERENFRVLTRPVLVLVTPWPGLKLWILLVKQSSNYWK